MGRFAPFRPKFSGAIRSIDGPYHPSSENLNLVIDAIRVDFKRANTRFESWLAQKTKAGTTFNPDQRVWIELIRDHIATSLSIEPGDFDYAPFNQRGGLGKAHQLFGAQLPSLLEELRQSILQKAFAGELKFQKLKLLLGFIEGHLTEPARSNVSCCN